MAVHAASLAPDRRGPTRELARSFRGALILPGQPGYDVHRRVWNGSIDRHPAVIARCATLDDVVAAVRYGRRTGIPIAVRGGGHSFPGLSVCDGGLVVDLRPMAGIRVDPGRRTVRVQAGALLGEVDAATQRHGLAVPFGAVSHTGVAGLTLGGGIGWLMRRHGLSIDSLLGVTLVTADGLVLRANATGHADLFWGVRGGGGSFGVVVEFTFRATPIGPEVLGGVAYWALHDGPEVARHYRAWSASLPDEITTALLFRRAPASDLVPRALHGRHVVGVAGCWSGALDLGERILDPMRRFGRPLLDVWGRRAFVEQQSMLDPNYPHGLWAYVRAADVAGLSDDVLDIAQDQAARIASARSSVTIWQLGGAVARVSPEATAFGNRTSGHVINVTGATDTADGFERERTWARDFGAALEPHQTGGYVNFLMDEGHERVRRVYGDRHARLVALKRRYDPMNVFRQNQNIDPADPSAGQQGRDQRSGQPGPVALLGPAAIDDQQVMDRE